MEKYKLINSLFFFLVILTFAFYESAEMSSVTYGSLNIDNNVAPYRYRLFLVVLCAGYCYFQKMAKMKNISGILTILLLYIWGISISYHTDGLMGSLIFSTNMFLPLVMFFYFYRVAYKISSKILYTGLFLTIIILLYAFVNMYNLVLISSLTDEVRFSTSYIFLFLLPFFLLSNNKLLKWGSVVFVAVLMVFSMKRGGILSFSLALIVFYYVSLISEKRKIKFKSFLWMLCVLIIIFSIISVGFESYYDDLIFRFTSIKDDGGSARDQVYEVTWRMVKESDVLSLCIGHGWNMVVEKSPMGLSAHNDFMEVIYDFGLFALFIYVYFYYKLYKTMFRMIKNHSEYAAPFAFSVIIFTVNSTISHVLIYPFFFIASTAVWGYILGKEKMSNQTFQIAKR